MALHDNGIMLTTPVSLSLPSWPVAPLLRRVFATLVSARRTSKTQPKTLAREVRSRPNASSPLTVLIPLTSSRLAPSDSPRVAFDPLLAHVPQPITSFKSLFFWLCEGLEMAGTQFTALCKGKPFGEHEESDEKIGSDGDNGGTLPIHFCLSHLLTYCTKAYTHTSSFHHQNDILTASLLSHHLEILEPSFPERSIAAVFLCLRISAS